MTRGAWRVARDAAWCVVRGACCVLAACRMPRTPRAACRVPRAACHAPRAAYSPVVRDTSEQRGEPVAVTLAVSVEEEDHVSGRVLRAERARLDQPVPLGVTIQLHLAPELRAFQVGLEARLQVFWKRTGSKNGRQVKRNAHSSALSTC